MARSKKACIVFFDEVDAIGGARFDDGVGGDNEVQRTMLEIVNQLDGFDARGNIKVLMATNRYLVLNLVIIFDKPHDILDQNLKLNFASPSVLFNLMVTSLFDVCNDYHGS